MFFLGVRVDHASATAFFVIMEKCLKNVRHYYTVKEACQTHAAACRDEMAAFYNDTAYTIRKRIYSQDRRPKKDVSARPTLVIAAGQDDLPLISSLRQADIPVEAVFLTGGSKACPLLTPGRAGTGKDHPASGQLIYETLSRVLEQQRLMFPDEASIRQNQLLAELARMLETLRRESPGRPPDAPLSPLLAAAAVPIWFRENIRYTSAYQASATSVRKFK